jgi:prepilin-type N-terminal cleavage/methylation domain-containing protein
MRARAGFTLVELLTAILIAGLIVTIAYEVLISGNRMFTSGLNVAYGQQGAMLFFETLESDLLACVVIPGHEREPMAVGKKNESISFYRTDHHLSTMQVTAASPVRYALKKAQGDGYHPTRNGVPMRQVLVTSLTYTLIPPGKPEERANGEGSPAWFVRVDAVFPERGLGKSPLVVKRLIELDQPTQSDKYYEAFSDEISPLSFLLSSGDPIALEELEKVGLGPGAGPPPVEVEMPPDMPDAPASPAPEGAAK